MKKVFKYRFLIEGNGRQRECFIRGSCPVAAETKLKATLEKDNEENNRNTILVKFVGI
jgi:transcription elongation factor GreA-like protein